MMTEEDSDKSQEPNLTVIDNKTGVDKLLSRLVDFHGQPRSDIPEQLRQKSMPRIPWHRSLAA
jgi:hypothetical protein